MKLDLTIPKYAYLFGLLLADGHHSGSPLGKGSVSLELSSRDSDILEAIRSTIPWNWHLSSRTRSTNFAKSHTSTVLSLHDQEVRAALHAAGLPVGNKSRSITPPDHPFSERDFTRGLFDGDGSLGFTAKGYPFISIVTDSEQIANWVTTKLTEIASVNRRSNRNTRDGVYNILLTGEPTKSFVKWLYQPQDLAINRKATAALQIIQWSRPVGMRRYAPHRPWTKEEDALVLSIMNTNDLSQRLGRTPSSIQTRRWRLQRSLTHP